MSATLKSPGTPERLAPRRQRGRLVTYVMVRLTGLLLAILVTGHLIVTHVVTDVARTDAGFIARRWSSALWVTWDSLMLAAALAHAAAGVWAAIDDYARKPAQRRRLRGLVVTLATALFVLGAYVIAKAVYS